MHDRTISEKKNFITGIVYKKCVLIVLLLLPTKEEVNVFARVRLSVCLYVC